MQPRTCFLEVLMTKLPSALEEPGAEEEEVGDEEHGEAATASSRSIENEEGLSFEEYFRSHELVYSKMRLYCRSSFGRPELTGRFKPISHLADCHGKHFRDLIHSEPSSTVPRHDQFDSSFESGNLGLVYRRA
jgi:hypothetical protein